MHRMRSIHKKEKNEITERINTEQRKEVEKETVWKHFHYVNMKEESSEQESA